MRRDSSNGTKGALRTALFAWGITTIILGIGFIVADYFLENEYVSLVFTSLSSAAFSIAGALLITEWILKPLYVRDVLQVASLSSEVYQTGLHAIKSSNEVEWSSIFASDRKISIAIGNENIFRNGLWTTVMTVSRTGCYEVRLHISTELAANKCADRFERQWRDNECSIKGSKLSIVPHGVLTQGLVVHCDQWVAVSVADDPLNDDPMLLLFRCLNCETVTNSLRRGIERLNNSDTTPIAGA